MTFSIPGAGETDLELPETARFAARNTANRWGIGGLCTTKTARVFAYFAGFSYLADTAARRARTRGIPVDAVRPPAGSRGEDGGEAVARDRELIPGATDPEGGRLRRR